MISKTTQMKSITATLLMHEKTSLTETMPEGMVNKKKHIKQRSL